VTVEGLHPLKSFRTIVGLLIGLAIAFSPVAAAWASIKTVTSGHSVAADTGAAATADMTDCEKMMRAAGHQGQPGTGNGDCPCCDTQNACPPDLCVFKCFKVFGTFVTPSVARVLTSLRFQPYKPDRPPDWIDSPQPPPPRA
jgi:hypothetical protein